MKKILIVEDDEKIAASLEIRLRSAGYEVAVAHDGLEGLKAALRIRPDLLVLDVWMPGSVGFLVAERIKRFGLEKIPVIFITASGKRHMEELANKVGAAGLFEKPFDADELLTAISAAMPKSRSQSKRDLPGVKDRRRGRPQR